MAHRTLEIFRRIRAGVPIPDGERFIVEIKIDDLECHLEEFEAGGEGDVVVWSSD
ncbi:hypothetical protein [Tsukamurella sp. PLM1]|uniref:hypothetical protein n=1 Tax=Tsukamurella sp. PLM1 TaxID=2929795 RepID=UPI00205F9C29|nr:hypothetical protein [Tsukamurella sp. PLM1]BDH58981.1 hypothetical protein MTP03_39200 [Tsukamurella sp. PLM1]